MSHKAWSNGSRRPTDSYFDVLRILKNLVHRSDYRKMTGMIFEPGDPSCFDARPDLNLRIKVPANRVSGLNCLCLSAFH